MEAQTSAIGAIRVSINGEARTFATPPTVAAVIAELGLAGRKIAVERNGVIVPRGRHAETCLDEGDRLEIVVAVGGG
jgi:sulfur carrier protein